MPHTREPRAPVTHLLYLHGFRSSPQSAKARQVHAWVQARHPELNWWCPQLPPSPKEAFALLDSGTRDWPAGRMGVIGSSLGGFYATCVAEARGCRCVVLNPAVEPARDLSRHIGEQVAWHDPTQRFFFQPQFVDELRSLHPQALARPQDYFALIARGDELLDWREMSARYAGGELHILEGGDHALSGFEAHIEEVMGFLGLG